VNLNECWHSFFALCNSGHGVTGPHQSHSRRFAPCPRARAPHTIPAAITITA
jgi:hypothetical protein